MHPVLVYQTFFWIRFQPRTVRKCSRLLQEKRHVHCGPSILRSLTQASLPGPFCRSLRCVVCTSETAFSCVSMLPEAGFCTFSKLSPHFRVFKDSQAVFRVFKDSQAVEDQWDHKAVAVNEPGVSRALISLAEGDVLLNWMSVLASSRMSTAHVAVHRRRPVSLRALLLLTDWVLETIRWTWTHGPHLLSVTRCSGKTLLL